jgi:MOSC domain-containing protein YiiM
MGDPKFLKAFAAARRPGTYLRIVGEGEIGAGDRVEQLSRPGHGVTIGEFAEAYLGDRDGLRRLLDAEQLSDRWRKWIAETLQRRRSAPE